MWGEGFEGAASQLRASDGVEEGWLLRAGGACMIIDDFGRHALLGHAWLGRKQ